MIDRRERRRRLVVGGFVALLALALIAPLVGGIFLAGDDGPPQVESIGDSGLGPYVLEISVTAETGGSAGCSHTDDGEEVEYLVELITLDYTIESA